MADAQVRPSPEFGNTDSGEYRLERFNEVLAAAGRSPAQAIVAVKARPITANGPHEQAIIFGEEYQPVLAAEGIGPQPQHPFLPYWLVADADGAPVVYEEHETGLEIVVAVVTIASGIATVVQVSAPYISRFIGRVRAGMRRMEKKYPGMPERTAFSVEVHADDRGYPVTQAAVEGSFDEAATERLIAAMGNAVADAFVAARP